RLAARDRPGTSARRARGALDHRTETLPCETSGDGLRLRGPDRAPDVAPVLRRRVAPTRRRDGRARGELGGVGRGRITSRHDEQRNDHEREQRIERPYKIGHRTALRSSMTENRRVPLSRGLLAVNE